VKGQCPRPLDEGDIKNKNFLFKKIYLKKFFIYINNIHIQKKRVKFFIKFKRNILKKKFKKLLF